MCAGVQKNNAKIVNYLQVSDKDSVPTTLYTQKRRLKSCTKETSYTRPLVNFHLLNL